MEPFLERNDKIDLLCVESLEVYLLPQLPIIIRWV